MAHVTDYIEQARLLTKQMTPEEKASLTSGRDFWCTNEIRRLSIPSVRMADGPHGLRRELEGNDLLGPKESHPSTCFPTASILACSFDLDMARAVGRALGEEALSQEVAVVLGPGANQKRSPLCGRGFEYFSEDPLLGGKLAAAMITGIQEKGVGASLKHFAVNNQEKYRMLVDAVVDERALHETYLAAFEYAVKEGRPWTVMSAYNRLNGTYCSENKLLLTDILRKDWGFEGAVVSDWGANNDRVAGVQAGQDLEMPGSPFHDHEVAAAVRLSHLEETVLDESAARMAALALAAAANRKKALAASENGALTFDEEAHHQLAAESAVKSMVLLKNENNLLPGDPSEQIAVIGGLARTPRFQGSGSSKVHAARIDTVCASLTARGISYTYAQGYPMTEEEDGEALLQEAVSAAAGKDKVYLFIGLPEAAETEGMDRSTLALPDSQNLLVHTILQTNPNTAVVLCSGGPVALPWYEEAPALLYTGLCGQAAGEAAVRLLFGEENPSGKLAETWPLSLQDTPAALYFPGGNDVVEYRESIYVGYRFYEKAKRPVRFPFGCGLSYTAFSYEGLRLSAERLAWGEPLTAYVTVTNTGPRTGTEIVQVYAVGTNEKVFLPEKQLAGFGRVTLAPGERQEVAVSLAPNSFAYYNTEIHGWYATPGIHQVLAGPSSAEVPLSASVVFSHEPHPEPDYRTICPDYFSIQDRKPFRISDESFYALVKAAPRPLSVQKMPPFDENITFSGARTTFTGRLVCSIIKLALRIRGVSDPMVLSMVWEMPMRSLFTYSQGLLTPKRLEGILDFLNGNVLRGIRKLLFS